MGREGLAPCGHLGCRSTEQNSFIMLFTGLGFGPGSGQGSDQQTDRQSTQNKNKRSSSSNLLFQQPTTFQLYCWDRHPCIHTNPPSLLPPYCFLRRDHLRDSFVQSVCHLSAIRLFAVVTKILFSHKFWLLKSSPGANRNCNKAKNLQFDPTRNRDKLAPQGLHSKLKPVPGTSASRSSRRLGSPPQREAKIVKRQMFFQN